MSIFEKKDLKNIIPYNLSSHKVWEIQTDKVLKLDWNESSILPSPKVKQDVLEYLNSSNLNWYPNTKNDHLLSLLARYTNVDVNNIQYFSSSDSIHEYVSRVFIDSGDEVLIVSPTYDNFRVVVESAGGRINLFLLDSNFNLDFSLLNNELKSKNYKLCYISNPNNPTGNDFDHNLLTETIIANPSVLFLIDEAYFEFSKKSQASNSQQLHNLIITRTFSKAFGLASFRIGYLISNVKIIECLNKIRNAKNIPMISQIAACSALEDLEYMNNYVLEVEIAKNSFLKELNSPFFRSHLKAFDSSANFILIDVFDKKKKDLITFLENNLIFIRDVVLKTLSEDHVRITIGNQEQMLHVLSKLKEFYSNEETSI